jgi:glycosyltransferase involved in cell wall biosynthesis
MKKKVIFMVINMNVGGTERALLNMVMEMPKDKNDITIFMLEEYGGFLDYIPAGVSIEYFKGYKDIKGLLNLPPKLLAINFLKQGRILKALIIIALHTFTKLVKDRTIFYKYAFKQYPTLEQEYDVAVAYAGPTDFISYFVINKIKAKKKIQWIHFDVTKVGFNPKFAAKIYNKFNHILVVSDEGRKKLISRVPILEKKTEVFQNIISPQLIYSQAKAGRGFTDDFDGLRILTVGRLSIEKGQDLAILALSKLIQDGFHVRWYCVGEGNSRGEYERMIEEFNVKDHFVLLGSDTNPYSYINQCDIYVQPSRHEGYCITLAEARCLKKPIITTNFTGAKEQIKNGENGFIVGIDAQEIYCAIRLLIYDKGLCEKFSNNLSAENFDSDLQIEKIYNILN